MAVTPHPDLAIGVSVKGRFEFFERVEPVFANRAHAQRGGAKRDSLVWEERELRRAGRRVGWRQSSPDHNVGTKVGAVWPNYGPILSTPLPKIDLRAPEWNRKSDLSEKAAGLVAQFRP